MKNCCSCGHRSTRDWLCSHGLYNVGQTHHQHGCWACRTRPTCCDPGCGCTNDTSVCGKVRRVSHRCRRAPLPDLACPRPRQILLYNLSYSALKTKRTTTSAMPLYTPYRSRSRLLRRCQPPPCHTRFQPIFRQERQPATAQGLGAEPPCGHVPGSGVQASESRLQQSRTWRLLAGLGNTKRPGESLPSKQSPSTRSNARPYNAKGGRDGY